MQVASVAEANAAESIAQKLRRLGYDAYVRMVKNDTKTWHRVRVGQLQSQKDAADLRNLLAEGYVPLLTPQGRRVYLLHTPRSVRGGLSFIF